METGIDQRRKLAARRTNKRLRLLTSAMNTLAVGIVGAAMIVPGINSAAALLELHRFAWLATALTLHVSAVFVLRWLKSEE